MEQKEALLVDLKAPQIRKRPRHFLALEDGLAIVGYAGVGAFLGNLCWPFFGSRASGVAWCLLGGISIGCIRQFRRERVEHKETREGSSTTVIRGTSSERSKNSWVTPLLLTLMTWKAIPWIIGGGVLIGCFSMIGQKR